MSSNLGKSFIVTTEDIKKITDEAVTQAIAEFAKTVYTKTEADEKFAPKA